MRLHVRYHIDNGYGPIHDNGHPLHGGRLRRVRRLLAPVPCPSAPVGKGCPPRLRGTVGDDRAAALRRLASLPPRRHPVLAASQGEPPAVAGRVGFPRFAPPRSAEIPPVLPRSRAAVGLGPAAPGASGGIR